MSTYGLIGLLVAFTGVAVSLVCFLVGYFASKKKENLAETLNWGAHIAVILAAISLTFCCGLMVFCFMSGDISIQYVVQNRSNSTSDLNWLYNISGLWGGREGSLMFWAWLISAFNTVVAIRNIRKLDKLDNMALFVSQLVLAGFVGILLFSENNMPFITLGAEYLTSNGELTGAALMWGMNVLLEHWAMVIHPPTLFVGYAGLTIPFAYAIAALITKDSSKVWVEKSVRYTVFSWLLLGLGIGLGSVWAYVVLGWGGYWGWDPVENASLLPWLVGVAFIHSLTIYRQRGAFKRWSIMCACITFAFVIFGTFITRADIVESVHSFSSDLVSHVLFLTLIIASLLAGLIGIIIRWKSFASDTVGGDDFDSLMSKDAAYYLNNLVMIAAAVVVAYLTVAPALPPWMPLGGLAEFNYENIARPLGILYLLILAVCPLLAWGKTQGKQFWKKARIPGICALILFAVLMFYQITYLIPSYDALIASGSTAAEITLEGGPAWYYHGLAALGFLVASLLFFNSLFMLGRGISRYAKSHETNVFVAAFGVLKNHAASYGGFIAHLAMAVILVGLIGSSMYVHEKIDYMGYDQTTNTGTSEFEIQGYTLKYAGRTPDPNGTEVADSTKTEYVYTVSFDVYKNGQYLQAVTPSIEISLMTQERKTNAGVLNFPTEDLFVIYRGDAEDGSLGLDVRVNPLISFVWAGFGLLMLGTLVALLGRRRSSRRLTDDGKVDDENVVTNEGKGGKGKASPLADGTGAVVDSADIVSTEKDAVSSSLTDIL